VVELGASDLHLAVPNPPVIRLNGGLQRLVDSATNRGNGR
jgi:Tfp pilus assembly pilus retraction ATPase PilT